MKTCKTCKWWVLDDSYHKSFRECSNPKITTDGEMPDDGAAIDNHDSLGLMPGPDFGCIHHEEAE